MENNNFQNPNGFNPQQSPYQDPNAFNQQVNPYQDPNAFNQQVNQQNQYQDPNAFNQQVNPYQDPSAFNQQVNQQNQYQDPNAFNQQVNQQQNQYQDSNAFNQQQNPYQDSNAFNQQQNPYQDPNAFNQQQNPYQDPNAFNQQVNQQQNPYQDPNAFNQQNQYQDPNTFNQQQYTSPFNPIPQDKPKAPKKTMSKKAKVTLFSIIGVIAALVVVAAVLLLTVFSPKKRLRKAVEATANVNRQVSASPLNDALGVDEISKEMLKNGGMARFGLTVNEIDGTNFYNSGFDSTCILDRQNKKFSTELEFVSDNKTLGDIVVLADENMTYVTLKDVIKGYLAFDNKNVISKYNNSVFAKESGQKIEEIDDFDIDLFGGDSKDLNEKVEKKAKKFSDKIWSESKVKFKGFKKRELGDKKVTCQKFVATIPEEVVEEIIGDGLDEYGNLMKQQAFASVFTKAGVSPEDIEGIISEAKTSIKQVITDDLDIEVYTYKGVVAEYVIETKVSGVKLKADIKHTGTDDILSATSIDIEVSVAGVKVKGNISYGSNKVKEGINTFAKFSINIPETGDVKAEYDQTYNVKEGTITGSGKMVAMDEELMSVTVNGKVEVEKGKSFLVDLNDISVNVDDVEAKFGFKFGMGVLSADVKPLEVDSSAKVVNIFEASVDDIQEFIMDNQDSITEWIMSISDNPLFKDIYGSAGGSGRTPDYGKDDNKGKEKEDPTETTTAKDTTTEKTTEDYSKDIEYLLQDEAKAEYTVEQGKPLDLGAGYSVTIDSFEAVDQRDPEYNEDCPNPGAVYVVTYTVKNDSWVDKNGIWDGIYVDLSHYDFLDKDNNIGEYYYLLGFDKKYSTQVKVGETAQFNAIIACKGAPTSGRFIVSLQDADGHYKYCVLKVDPAKKK